MGFRLVPKSVTFNELEQRNGSYSALFHRIQYSFRGALRNSRPIVEDIPKFSATEM